MLSLENSKKNLVGLAIERAIIDVGGNKTLYQVLNFLYENYRCYTADCLEHPKYLLQALKEQDVKDASLILDSINKKLDEYSDDKSILTFLMDIKHA
ncbi:MAG: hypothetical protein ACT4N1_00130 [Nitrososphaerota archaeon]